MSLVTYRPIGRLGNQLFQLAATIGYAKKHNMEWAVPTNTYEVPDFHQMFPNLPLCGLGGQPRYNACEPAQFPYHEIPRYRDGVILVGFFQSLKFFEHAQEEVKNAINIKYVDGYENHTSLHVRRGDYIEHSASFPPITLDYISEALSRIPSGKVLVFSDDIDWCRHNIPASVSGVDFEFSEGRSTYEDLCLMASCGNHIIANSSFSWWGAYLGRNPEKIIVSPHHESWFGKSNGSYGFTQDLIPEGWNQIKFR